MKKLISIALLMLVLLCAVFSLSSCFSLFQLAGKAIIKSEILNDDLEFTLNDDGESYTLKGVAGWYDLVGGVPIVNSVAQYTVENLVIPSTYKDMPVTAIGDYAFLGCESLKSVTVPDGITSIGEAAFSGCTNLSAVTVSASVMSVSNYAFYGCTSLKEIELLGVRTVGESAFYQCTALESVSFYEIETIGTVAFYGCERLSYLNISETLTGIGGGAFEGCVALDTFYIPEKTERLGEQVFVGCDNIECFTVSDKNSAYKDIDGNLYTKDGSTLLQYALGKRDEEFTVPDTVTTIGDCAFYNDESLQTITVPDSVTTIGEGAFSGCKKLKEVSLGNGVSEIGPNLFSNSEKLIWVSLGSGVESISDTAFYGCESLEYIGVHYNNSHYDSEEGVLFDKGQTRLIKYPCAREVSEYEVPATVLVIGESAFDSAQTLREVYLHNGIKVIEAGAFADCKMLEEINLPHSLERINTWAFASCTALEKLGIPAGVLVIEDSAFYLCDGLTIYCEVKEKPDGWDDDWNCSKSEQQGEKVYNSYHPVVWDY